MDAIITANRLTDGVVVFADSSGGWTEDFHRAAVFADEPRKAALSIAKQSEARNEVIDPYEVEIETRNGHFAPKALREAIRASGPTIRHDLGKQADGLAPTQTIRAATEPSHVSL